MKYTKNNIGITVPLTHCLLNIPGKITHVVCVHK